VTDDDDLHIYEDASGRRHAILKGGRIICDFCLAPNPPWTYPAGHVHIVGHRAITDSDDPWAACDTCHDLIEAENHVELVEHMLRGQKHHSPPDARRIYPPDLILRLTLRENVMRFLAARTGPAERDLTLPEGYE
jgi:hypothetical protein